MRTILIKKTEYPDKQEQLRPLIGNGIYGYDDCQRVPEDWIVHGDL